MAMTSVVVVVDKERRLSAEVRAITGDKQEPTLILSITESNLTYSGCDIQMSEAQLETLAVLVHAALAEINEHRRERGEHWLAAIGQETLASTRYTD